MRKQTILRSKHILFGFLIVMIGMIIYAHLYTEAFIAFLKVPIIVTHARFFHIVAATMFFANAVVGILWEKRSLASGSKQVILHTYNTVAFLDSHFSSPLIILSILGGLSLSITIGDLWKIGWLSVSFVLFLLSGFLWVVVDIPTQYKIKKIISELKPDDETLPIELIRLLNLRWWISLTGVVPLIIVFILMVYQPEISLLTDWFR